MCFNMYVFLICVSEQIVILRLCTINKRLNTTCSLSYKQPILMNETMKLVKMTAKHIMNIMLANP